jgi:hypothetical protein
MANSLLSDVPACEGLLPEVGKRIHRTPLTFDLSSMPYLKWQAQIP